MGKFKTSGGKPGLNNQARGRSRVGGTGVKFPPSVNAAGSAQRGVTTSGGNGSGGERVNEPTPVATKPGVSRT